MKALVYQGSGAKAYREVPDPTIIDPRDAIIRVAVTAICGTDLHILAGDVPTVPAGRILGHEAVGTVVQVGPGVTNLKPNDRVLASCISACGFCRSCRRGRYGQCVGGGGWLLGNLVDGVQAELARIPFADLSTYRLPAEVSDETAVLLADVLPTAYEVGVLNGQVRPGDTVAVIGAGPIGLAAIIGARLFSPAQIVAVDRIASRRQAAKQFGADVAIAPEDDPLRQIHVMTGGRGADVAIEAVGLPEAFETCTSLVRSGGRVASIGVYGAPATLHLEQLWHRDLTITTGLVDTYSTQDLLAMLKTRQINPHDMITHRYPLHAIVDAYDLFARAADTGALKVVLHHDHNVELS